MSLRIPFDYKKNVNFSVRNLSVDKRMSIKPGTLIPIYFKKLYPGDKFDIDLSTLIQSNPLITPLMGEFVLRLSTFFEPDSNLYGWLDNNSKLTTNELLHRKRHYISAKSLPYYLKKQNGNISSTSYENFNRRGSLYDFVGFPPLGGFPTESDNDDFDKKYSICADRVLTYLDVVRNYYFANQTIAIPYIYYPPITTSLFYLKRETLDDFFLWLRQQDDGIDIFDAAYDSADPTQGMRGYFSNMKYGGLFCAQYEPDMLRNILLDVDTTKVAVNITDNSFSIDTLRFQNKLQRLVDRYDISGGRFSSWLKTVWGSSANRRLDIPQFIGTTSFIIDPNTVTSVADTSGTPDDSNLGQLGGNINQANYKGKNNNTHQYVSVDEPGTLVIIASLVPKVDYSQGLERELRETLFSDDYKPEFSQLGFQDVPWSDYSVFPNLDSNGQLVTITSGTGGLGSRMFEPDSVVGKQIAWMHLMSDVNRVHGEFAEDGFYSTWVLRRSFTKITQYTADSSPRPYTTQPTNDFYYVNPFDWYYMFAVTDGSLDNFFLQVGLNIRAVRPIGKRYMPTLE